MSLVTRASEGQAAEVYGTGFTADGVGFRDRMWELGIKVGSDKELTRGWEDGRT